MKRDSVKGTRTEAIDDQYLYGYTLAMDSLEDYLACRTLLEQDQPLVAIQLGTTAIEKLFKAFINFSFEGKFEFRTHSPYKLYDIGEVAFINCNLIFDKHFFKWLDDVYVTRYSSSIYPAKEITFGHKQFLGRMDRIFFEVFSHFKAVNIELAQLYFCNPFQENLSTAYYNVATSNFNEYVSREQKIYSIFFVSGRRTDAKSDVYAYNPDKPFVFKDAELENERLILRLNFGFLSQMDLPPSYYENVGSHPGPIIIDL